MTDAARGFRPQAEDDLRVLATKDNPVKEAAQQIQQHWPTLFRLFHADDPSKFAEIVRVYRGNVNRTIMDMIDEDPINFGKNAARYARDIIDGPNGYIHHLFRTKFEEEIRSDTPEIRRVMRSIDKIDTISLYVDERPLARDRQIRRRRSVPRARRAVGFHVARGAVIAAGARRGVVRSLAR